MPEQSTKQLIEVTDIKNNVIFLRNSSLRVIVSVSSINFDLRSEEEQSAILQNFQRFLNAIDFPLQIVIHSRKFDISRYIKSVERSSSKLSGELLKIQAAEYMKFIEEISELANIMSKKFYIVIPFYISEAPGSSSEGTLNRITGLFKKSATKQETNTTKDGKFTSYRNQLLQRAEMITDGLITLGLKAQLLEDEALLDMFFSLYNPGAETTVARASSEEPPTT